MQRDKDRERQKRLRHGGTNEEGADREVVLLEKQGSRRVMRLHVGDMQDLRGETAELLLQRLSEPVASSHPIHFCTFQPSTFMFDFYLSAPAR